MYFVEHIEVDYNYLMMYFNLMINEKTLYNRINNKTEFFNDNNFDALNDFHKSILSKYLTKYEVVLSVEKGLNDLYKKLNICSNDLYNFTNCHKIILHLNKLKILYKDMKSNEEICTCYIYLYNFKKIENKIAMYFNRKN